MVKTQMKIIRIKFTSPLHISNVRGDYDISEKIFHSDSMYSAIIEAWNVLGLSGFIPKSANENLPFAISSLFPFTFINNIEEHLYFLPRPASFKPDVPISINKKVKKIEYIDSFFFKQLQQKGKICIDEGCLKGIYYTDKPIDSNLMIADVQPRVRVPRGADDSKPFYTERIYFKENSGLYFFLHYESDEIYRAILAALDYLKDEGIGTDRHVGNGMFTYEVDENAHIIHFDKIDSKYSLNLSLFIPESHQQVKQIIDDKSYFETLIRGGWITSYPYITLRKKYVRTIKEGSVLQIEPGIYGKIADVTPDKNMLPPSKQEIHPIFRVGKSIWVPFKICN